MTRDPDWQQMMLQKPLQERLLFAAQARAASAQHGQTLSEEISDVNLSAVNALMSDYGVTTMLHGHTHRPAVHDFLLNGHAATRIVLGDWYEQGSLVRWIERGPELVMLPR
jgi:UDP-2,3-diacylglucosamine hydrolase